MTKTLQNKPRVFLSHSNKDKEFINRIYEDLRLCQIEPWLDEPEIRHGQPWLDAIFESGIPTCNAILVYLTESSIEPAMVKKEVDAGIIKKLKESHVAFLPYVSQEILREQLRMDIQALQTPVWNSENYSEMLPRVVAEIWHSYLDSVVVTVANEEKVRRLEAELELEKLRKTGVESIFDARELADFDFIWKEFEYEETIKLIWRYYDELGNELDRSSNSFCIKIQTIISQLGMWRGSLNHPEASFLNIFHSIIKDCFGELEEDSETIELEWTNLSVFINKLKMYGLVNIDHYRLVIVPTEKLDRFRYWLSYKEFLPNELIWRKI